MDLRVPITAPENSINLHIQMCNIWRYAGVHSMLGFKNAIVWRGGGIANSIARSQPKIKLLYLGGKNVGLCLTLSEFIRYITELCSLGGLKKKAPLKIRTTSINLGLALLNFQTMPERVSPFTSRHHQHMHTQ